MPIKSIISILAVLACLIFPALITCSHDSTLKKKPVSVRGVLDLRDWNFTKDGPLNLDGEWEFYWDRLIEPSDFTKRADRKDCGFISVPGLWESCKVHGADLPGNGYATYRLKIISGPDKKMKFLSIHRIFSGSMESWRIKEKKRTNRQRPGRIIFLFTVKEYLPSLSMRVKM